MGRPLTTYQNTFGKEVKIFKNSFLIEIDEIRPSVMMLAWSQNVVLDEEFNNAGKSYDECPSLLPQQYVAVLGAVCMWSTTMKALSIARPGY